MRNHKSHTEIFLGLYKVLLTEDMVRQYGNPTSFARDFETIQNRVKNEGFSFLTKTLPLLGKAIDYALADGGALATSRHFKKCRKGAFPAFLQVLHERVFERDGSVKIDPCISAVSDLRQILFFAYKYEGDVDYDQRTFLDHFKAVDISLGWESTHTREDVTHPVLRRARTLLSRLLRDICPLRDIYPKHGPGAVATGEKNWEKMKFRRKYTSIHQIFPYYKFFFSNAMDLAANVRLYKQLETIPSGIAKVVFVPKDSRGPRLISMEPLEYQWVQQGVKKVLYDWIENHPLTRGHVSFTDQEINRNLALQGSMSKCIATLDMKEASDRIPLWLVEYLFNDTIWDVLEATRSEATEFPDGEIHLLRKFAPMGSALCFPIEALVHWSLAVATLCENDGIALKQALRSVFVYGDDIIIKDLNHQSLFDTFPLFGLKFNQEKCCTKGIFRESCGMDAVLGRSVTCVKIKKQFPKSPYDADRYVSILSVINTLWDRAYYSSSTYLENYLYTIVKKVPKVGRYSSVPGLITNRWNCIDVGSYQRRWNPKLHRYERKVPVVRGKKITHELDRSEYQRKLLNLDDEFVSGVYAVPRCIKLSLGWRSEHDCARS